MQLGAWENAYFATRSKSRQKCVNCIILANLWNLWCFFTPWSWNYQYVGTVLCSQKSETHSSKKRKADNVDAQQGTSQINSEIRSRSMPQPNWTGWLRKHAFAGSERVSRLLGPVKSSKSCFFGQRLWLRAFSHQTFTMSLINQMDSTCIEKNTFSGIRLIGQKYQAKLVSEPAKLLGAWRRCLHASADSRTGGRGGRYIDEKLSRADKSVFLKLSATYR